MDESYGNMDVASAPEPKDVTEPYREPDAETAREERDAIEARVAAVLEQLQARITDEVAGSGETLGQSLDAANRISREASDALEWLLAEGRYGD